ncbi:hypothetical protein DFH06DRAFT_1164049 [Mycena polygramma]|nr:hypothetical protein DFH06DRAFT_1164049 [Mycena polygramma]
MYPSKEDIKTRITATKANISQLTTQIHELERARQDERRALGRLQLMIVPVGKLATELLVEIFALVLGKKSYSNDPIRHIFLLYHVCSPWRQIISSSPTLWAHCMVEVELDKPRRSVARYIDGLQALLDRSVPLAFPVSLVRGDHVINESRFYDNKSNSAILKALIPSASRWKNLELDDECYAKLARLIPPGSFLTLENLILVYPEEQWLGQQGRRIFAVCPHLRRLTLILARQLGSNKMLQMPLSQLTHLDLWDENFVRSRAMLLQCTHLVSAKLRTKGWDATDASAPATTLPCLKEFHLQLNSHGNPIGQIEPFLVPLSLPSLESFDLDCDTSMIWPAEAFSAFQIRSPNIAQLSLTKFTITITELVALLRLTSALTTLSLAGCQNCVETSLFQALIYDETSPQQLVPRLRSLSFRNVPNNVKLEDRVVQRAIRSRWGTDAAVARLQSLKISHWHLGKNFRKEMRDLVEQGLELNF